MPKPKAKEGKATYKTLTHVRHDGKFYPQGSKIELEDKHAQPLIDGNNITPLEE